MKILILLMSFVLVYSPIVLAQPHYDEDIRKFQQFNPDGPKYDFVKNYLVSLTYLKKNAERSQNSPEINAEEFEKGGFFQALMDELIQENINLRVAKNFLKKYQNSNNGLILKVRDLFTQICDEQIDVNNKERTYIGKVLQTQIEQGLESVDIKTFMRNIQGWAMERRTLLQKLLEASMMINKILVSNQIDEFGEFVMLGVTEAEREGLLLRMDTFYEEGFQGELRQGQTFLQASVSIIREILEDDSWDTLRRKD